MSIATKGWVRRLLTPLYIWIRRLVRSFIVHIPLVDQVVGDLLRRVERRLHTLEHLISLESDGRIEFRGGILTYRPQDKGVITTLLLNGEYEPETTEEVLRILKPGMTFVDLGAHIGYFTLLAARAVAPTGRVYAFEPEPSTCEVLRHNVILNGLDQIVTIVPKAISDRKGSVHFLSPSESTVSARIADDRGYGKEGNSIEVEAISLDDYFREIGWPEIHLIKMDIEGAEIQALRGMMELSRRNAKLNLIIEVNYPHLARLKIHPQELIKALQACGFSRFRPLKRGFIGYWMMPQDLGRLIALAKRMTFNLLCKKS